MVIVLMARFYFLLCLGDSDFVFAKVLKTMLVGDRIAEFLLDMGDKFEDQVTIAHLFESKEAREQFFKKVEGFGYHLYALVIYVNKPKNVIEVSPFSCESEFKEFVDEISKTVTSNVEKRVSTYVA